MNRNMKQRVAIIACSVGVAGVYGVGRLFADYALKRGSSADDAVKETLKGTELTAAQIVEQEKTREASIWSAQALPEEQIIQSADGLSLHGFFYENKSATTHYVILLHGFQDDHRFMEPYALQYFQNGYHVLIPDQRAHGRSDGKYTTMGWKEQGDLRRWINWIIARNPDASILLHGVSMGAATLLLAAGGGLPENVRACVSDCAYTSLWAEYRGKICELYHIPAAPILIAADLASRVKPGFWIHRASPVTALRQNRIPILFIHGDADDYNPYWMMDVLFQADACERKEALTIPGARHARSVYTDYEAYWSGVWRFAEQYI